MIIDLNGNSRDFVLGVLSNLSVNTLQGWNIYRCNSNLLANCPQSYDIQKIRFHPLVLEGISPDLLSLLSWIFQQIHNVSLPQIIETFSSFLAV